MCKVRSYPSALAGPKYLTRSEWNPTAGARNTINDCTGSVQMAWRSPRFRLHKELSRDAGSITNAKIFVQKLSCTTDI